MPRPQRARQSLVILAGILLLAGAGFWFLTQPQRLDEQALANLAPGDPVNGEMVFWASGCASCHAAPGATDDARLELGGGLAMETAFGTFIAPNISPGADGIGDWSLADFANAVQQGVAPDGRHLYPAFPYPSYTRMSLEDTADLFAFIKTLPPVSGSTEAHTLAFPWNLRRGIGLWKRLYLDDRPVVALPDDASEAVRRGQYLVEGPGHCGQCHTPRDAFGGLDRNRWLAGAAAPEGDGKVPNITPSPDGLADWSAEDIAFYLESGFTPTFDAVGGSMAEVQANMAHLDASDREAIAAYLKAVPALPDAVADDAPP